MNYAAWLAAKETLIPAGVLVVATSATALLVGTVSYAFFHRPEHKHAQSTQPVNMRRD
jgi:hypothetical protein